MNIKPVNNYCNTTIMASTNNTRYTVVDISFTHAVPHNVLYFCTLAHTVLKHASQRDSVREAKTHQTGIQLCAGEEKGRKRRVGGRNRGLEVETKSEVGGGEKVREGEREEAMKEERITGLVTEYAIFKQK